jgi:hypothetical protein
MSHCLDYLLKILFSASIGMLEAFPTGISYILTIIHIGRGVHCSLLKKYAEGGEKFLWFIYTNGKKLQRI